MSNVLDTIVNNFNATIQTDDERVILTTSAEDVDDAFDIICELCDVLEESNYTIVDSFYDHDTVQVILSVKENHD